jgi:hypothetical protein
MSNSTPLAENFSCLRFEQASPAQTIVAFLAADLKSLVAPLCLPIFDGYDDLDDLQFTFLSLPEQRSSVTLGQYQNSPHAGVDLYIDLKAQQDISALVVAAFQQLKISREAIIWLHPDWQTEIERLYAQFSESESSQTSVPVEELPVREYEPIDCFNYALNIYNRADHPEYWAMLQHSLGLAYFDRIQGNKEENLKRSIKCFRTSLEVFTREDFPSQWEMNWLELIRLKEKLKILLAEKINAISRLVQELDADVEYMRGHNPDSPMFLEHGRSKLSDSIPHTGTSSVPWEKAPNPF